MVKKISITIKVLYVTVKKKQNKKKTLSFVIITLYNQCQYSVDKKKKKMMMKV